MISPTNHWSRRNFLSALAAGGIGLPTRMGSTSRPAMTDQAMSLHVFSKHLQFLDYQTTARVAAEIGFDGIDLAVRPGGHVLPENVTTDLPRAVEAIRKAGLQAQIMTTAIMDPQEGAAEQILRTAKEVGIRRYRTNWLRYNTEDINLPEVTKNFRQQLQALAQLNQRTGMIGGYQNHAGDHYVGAPVWDIATLLYEIDSEFLGSQYDIRHATVEGGLAWPLGLDLIHPFINVIVIKDFRWEKIDGQWQVLNVPIGEGMVDFPRYFKLLKQYDIRCPISVHFEYEMPEQRDDLSEEERLAQTIKVMKKDVNTLKQYLSEADLLTQ